MNKPESLFQDPLESKNKRIFNPQTLQQIARDNIKLDDKQLNKKLGYNMNNPYYFTDRALQVGFNITLESHKLMMPILN